MTAIIGSRVKSLLCKLKDVFKNLILNVDQFHSTRTYDEAQIPNISRREVILFQFCVTETKTSENGIIVYPEYDRIYLKCKELGVDDCENSSMILEKCLKTEAVFFWTIQNKIIEITGA
ncbi:hypothetical protein RF11_06343 [Thelohanellus kitauei]|uniref:Uncharacterized protein n=1 Tax=Thelohanellus kitauei TaxID=669202 RepID=A0A0C2N849_THEKT|nr:hypothetical protein RF11_06343 [Thelohanellus kitauei]